MARTPLFGALARASVGSPALNRRTFLAQAAAYAAVACAPLPVTDAPEPTTDTGSPPRLPSIAVIGGGLAGVLCAERLRAGGLTDVVVFESAARLGGRLYTLRGLFPDGLIGELGGERVDSGHATVRALVEELGLSLRDDGADGLGETFEVGGRAVPASVIQEQLAAVAPGLHGLFLEAEASEERFKALDQTPLSALLDAWVPAHTYPELRSVLEVAYRGEFGLEISEQSALNLIYLLATREDPASLYGDSDERYAIVEGADALVERLAARLPSDAVRLSSRLVAVSLVEAGYRLVLDGVDGRFEHQCDQVVFAIPFSSLRKVELLSAGLSSLKLHIIGSYSYGTNGKVLGVCTEPVWRTTYGVSGAVTTDRPAQQFWDATRAESGSSVLVNFLGGRAGEAPAPGTALAAFRAAVADLDLIWPGVAAVGTTSAARAHWATVQDIEGSYACYQPGQWAWYGLEGLSEGGLHFCGEHCSGEFQGYMEGAAVTGAAVARAVLTAAGLA